GAMLSEAIHTIADVGNQALLLLGLRQALRAPDTRHPYGYGQASFFWALVSALGIFFLGCGVTVAHGVESLVHPPEHMEAGWLTWTVLGVSFLVDGWALHGAVTQLREERPEGMPWSEYRKRIKDPMLLAVLLEDSVACFGVLAAVGGIAMASWTGDPTWDAVASIVIGLLLGFVAVTLVRMNQRFLIGSAVDPEIDTAIKEILATRSSIEAVHRIQSRWVGPSTFAYKAEVDFDGTWFAAELQDTYGPIFRQANEEEAVSKLLGIYTEHVARLMAREVDAIETQIAERFPQAAFIELEPSVLGD
ncbi:MAG: cation diffusion facilitator family transporter, partial [Myxococcales bacterium]|nr:cation diffusion facilitator family transporter [Myxococcales bacterium]